MRESISQPGSYTLVVSWAGETINFLFSAISQPDGTSTYRLTSDSFQTVAELIRHHVKTGCPVSESSPAVLRYPIDRSITTAEGESGNMPETSPLIPDPHLTTNSTRGGDAPYVHHNSKGRNITSRLSPAYFANLTVPSLLDTHETSTNSAQYLQLMDLVKSILFSSKVAYLPLRLLEHSPAVLAMQITRGDLVSTQLGLGEDDSGSASDRLGVSGLQRLLMPYNHSLQREVWFQHCQLKYLVLLSLFAASNLDARSSLLAHLISLAKELSGPTFRNVFGFMSIMEALMSPHLSKLTNTWGSLREKSSGILTVFELQLKPLALSYFSGLEESLPPPLIPYLQPVLYNILLRVQEVLPEDASRQNSLMSGLDAFLNHFEAARRYSLPTERLSGMQKLLKREAEDPALKHFLQQNHVKTLLSKIERRFLDDFELYGCAETLISILAGLMSDY